MSKLLNKLSNRSTSLVKVAEEAAKQQERAPSEFFINIGFRKMYDDQERFVQIPVVITADNIRKGIESVQKHAGKNSPDDWLEFIDDRVMLGEDIVALFSELDEGSSVVNKEIPDTHELAYLQDLEVQFIHRDMSEKTYQPATKASVADRRKAFKR